MWKKLGLHPKFAKTAQRKQSPNFAQSGYPANMQHTPYLAHKSYFHLN
jgi:hypothetical protein